MQTNCTQCGRSVPADAKFCPVCGAAVTSTSTTKTTINVQAPIPAARPDQKDDLNPERIQAYREAIGLTTSAPFVYGYYQNLAIIGAIGPLGVLVAQKYFVLSREANGILLLGLTMTNHFNGKNLYLDRTAIEQLKIANHGLNYHLTIRTSDGRVKASIVKLMVGRPWQRTNAKLIAQDLANFT